MAPPSSKISGIPVTSIINMKSVNASSITSICGITTSTIPGWPTGGGCVIRTFGYADLSSDPLTACEFFYQRPINYFYDETLNVLYGEGESCGGVYAPEGYYSDGVNIYEWRHEGEKTSFTQIGICR
jgi:hypothetical protein